MAKKKLEETMPNEKVFWVILGFHYPIFAIENVGGNRFYLVFSTEKKVKQYYDATDHGPYHWDNPVTQKTWGEILSMTGGDKWATFYHFDLSPNAEKIDSKKIICSKQR
jgi:hypothetical protein